MPSPPFSEGLIYVPVSAAAISLLVFAAQLVAHQVRKHPIDTSHGDRHGPSSSLRDYITDSGGASGVILNLLRLLSCIAVLGIAVHDASSLHSSFRAALLSCATYAYTAFIGSVSFAFVRWNATASSHLTFVLLTTWVVYVYRDIWPLATYYLEPADRLDTHFWSSLAALSVAAVLVPLTLPRKYVPYDPQDPMATPNPEQTCSILSRVLFTFLDSVVWTGYRSPRLVVEQLPPLCDYEHMKYMSKRSAPYLDPLDVRSSRHVFWGLLRMYKWEYVELWFELAMMTLSSFLIPVGMNRVLNYLETGGVGARMHLWFWILTFVTSFVGTSLLSGRYMFVALRVLVEAQNALTQLVFEHALRIRLKADADHSPDPVDSNVPTDGDSEHTATHGRDDSEATQGESRSSTPIVEGTTAASGAKDIQEASPGSRKGGSIIGKINNLISTDVNNLENGHGWIMLVWFTPLQIVLSLIFLYVLLGWSSLIGVVTMLVMLYIPGVIAAYSHRLQEKRMAKSDTRVGVEAEVLGGAIRMVKLFGWELKMSERIDEKRRDELNVLRDVKILSVVNKLSNTLIPMVTMIVTFASYTLIAKGELTASKVFSAIQVFHDLQNHFSGWTQSISSCIQAKVSLDRITDFLRKTELLDSFNAGAQEHTRDSAQLGSDIIGIRAASFSWDIDAATATHASQSSFRLRIEEEIVFKRGHVNLIIGPTGSGKTSLLMALLGEMHYTPMGPNSYVNLPRGGGIAYHAQESWVLNETIQNNIVFGSPFEQERYNKVLHQCALEHDLSLFEAGDQTEVGERGMTLSGGQKARITLARAIYSNADILLLDDVLAALDVHTAQAIVDDCFRGDLIRGRTVILVTHNVALAAPIAEFVVSLGTNGRIKSQGTLSSALEHDAKLAAYAAEEESRIKRADNPHNDKSGPELEEQKANGKLMVEEEVAEGHVGWSALKLLLSNMAQGPRLVIFWLFVFTIYITNRTTSILTVWILGLWAKQYELHNPSEVAASYYLSLYSGISAFSVVLVAIGYITYTYGTLRAARIIHRTLVETVLSATFRWLDKTPSSRIITRCTQDISAVDNKVAENFAFLAELTAVMVMKFGAVILVSPTFAAPGLVLILIGGSLFQFYIKAQLPIKRELSNAKAPVMGHITAAVNGLVSIRAYGAQEAFRQESFSRLDRLTRTARVYRNLSKWISVRAELLSAVFMASLASYMVYGTHEDASTIGFTLNMGGGFSHLVLWFFLIMNEFQVEANSLERIQQYLVIEQEPKPTDTGVPPAYWPSSGSLRVEKLSARYSEDGTEVLHDISFEVKSGERVGIVGRTGSGKSSLALALLRCIPTKGKVFFDGLPTDSVNLDALRSNVTIIPQVPELLTGTLRENLDPFSQHDDATLNEALRSAGLFTLQGEADAARLTLDSSISSSGGNLSVGQRQIIALARAIVRRSKLLILDEATSAIDYAADAVIQDSLRKEGAKDVTLLTVAHRLQTVMDSDKIMVLDAGRIVEFGPPAELLRNAGGFFTSLVNASGDKDVLYATAAGDA